MIVEAPKKIIVKVDSQIVNSIMLCLERYRMEHVLNMRPNKKAEALERGNIMHTMIAHYYRNRMTGRMKVEANIVISEALMMGREEAAAARSFEVEDFEKIDIPTFRRYILHHQYDGWTVKFVEQPFSKVLYDSDDLMIIYEGVIDLGVERVKEGPAVVDHKTESRKSYPSPLSVQFTGYHWAFGQDVIVNKIGYQTTLTDKERFRRYHFIYSEATTKEWLNDVVHYLREAIRAHNENYFPMNRTSCDKYSGCIFKRVCEAEPQVREYKLQAYFYKDKPWDPYTRDEE